MYRAPVFGGTYRRNVRSIDTGITFSPDGSASLTCATGSRPSEVPTACLKCRGHDEKIIVEGPMSESRDCMLVLRWQVIARSLTRRICRHPTWMSHRASPIRWLDSRIWDLRGGMDGGWPGLLVVYYGKGSTGIKSALSPNVMAGSMSSPKIPIPIRHRQFPRMESPRQFNRNSPSLCISCRHRLHGKYANPALPQIKIPSDLDGRTVKTCTSATSLAVLSEFLSMAIVKARSSAIPMP